MSFLMQPLEVVHWSGPQLFWLIYSIITPAAAISAAFAIGRVANGKEKSPIILTPKSQPLVGKPKTIAALTLLAVFLGSYIAMTLAWEDFADIDNSAFTLFTLRGYPTETPIWSGQGRFFPLGLQEFNLVRYFTDTIYGYHFVPITQILILSCILLVLDDELSITVRAALAILALLTPSILTSFSGLIYPERNVLFFLACLVLSVKRFEQTQSIVWAVAAVVCGQIMIYYKETAFLLVLGFAAGRLLLRCLQGRGAGWDYNLLRDKESRLDLCLLSLAVIFICFYLGVVVLRKNTSFHYATENQGAEVQIVLWYIRSDVLAWVFMAVALSRTYLILRQRTSPWPLWDGLAFGGVAYFVAYLCLRLFTVYYLAPVDLVAVLYVGRVTVLSWEKMPSWNKVVALILTFTVVSQVASLSACAVLQRKIFIHGKAVIASALVTRYRSGGGTPLRLFFPFSPPFIIAEFGSYLNYRGLPVEGVEAEAAGLNSAVLATRAITEDGLCVYYRPAICHAVNGPTPGDLVVVFPEDSASLAEASMYRERDEPLFSYKPLLYIPHRLYSLVDYLSVTWPKTLAERWDGSVTLSK
jgi:hypothetical protein